VCVSVTWVPVQAFEASHCSGKRSISIMLVCFWPVITNTVYSTNSSMYSVMSSKLESFPSFKPSFVPCTQKSPSMLNTLHFQLPVPRPSGAICMEGVVVQFQYTQFRKTPKGTLLAFSIACVFGAFLDCSSYSIEMLCF
jgi:hypothetical protein